MNNENIKNQINDFFDDLPLTKRVVNASSIQESLQKHKDKNVIKRRRFEMFESNFGATDSLVSLLSQSSQATSIDFFRDRNTILVSVSETKQERSLGRDIKKSIELNIDSPLHFQPSTIKDISLRVIWDYLCSIKCSIYLGKTSSITSSPLSLCYRLSQPLPRCFSLQTFGGAKNITSNSVRKFVKKIPSFHSIKSGVTQLGPSDVNVEDSNQSTRDGCYFVSNNDCQVVGKGAFGYALLCSQTCKSATTAQGESELKEQGFSDAVMKVDIRQKYALWESIIHLKIQKRLTRLHNTTPPLAGMGMDMDMGVDMGMDSGMDSGMDIRGYGPHYDYDWDTLQKDCASLTLAYSRHFLPPFLVTVYQMTLWQDATLILMPYAELGTLLRYINQCRAFTLGSVYALSGKEVELAAAFLAVQMLTVLEFLHHKYIQVCHEDIKSDNWVLRFADDGTVQVCLIDFGLAREASIKGDKSHDIATLSNMQKDAVGLGGCVLSMLYFETSQEVSNEKVHIKNAEFDEDIGTVFTCHFAAARGYKVITLMEMLLSQLPRTITQPFALSIPVMSLKRYWDSQRWSVVILSLLNYHALCTQQYQDLDANPSSHKWEIEWPRECKLYSLYSKLKSILQGLIDTCDASIIRGVHRKMKNLLS